MKITLIHYSAPPVVGGVEMVIKQQAGILSHAGHQVKILAGRGSAWVDSIPVVTLPLLDSRHPDILKLKSSLDNGIVPPEFPAYVKNIKEELLPHIENEEVLICHNVASLHKNLAFTAALHELAGSFTTKRMVLWHHDFAWTTPRYANELYKGYPWDLLKIFWENVIQVVISEPRREELSELISLPKENIKVIPNGLDINTFLSLDSQTEFIVQTTHLLEANPFFICPVRLTTRKNIELAIEIIIRLRKLLPNPILVVTGPPGAHNPANLAYLEKLHQLINHNNLQENVILLADRYPDGVNDDCIASLYRLADALLLTSLEEGFGIPILEAGLSRLLIFCTDLQPLIDLAGNWGHYFSANDPPSQIAQMINDTLNTDSAYQLRAHIRNHYTWEAVYKQKIAPLLEEI
jgi:glycosyltransferase involved in cell wall biosynthesis